MPNEFFCIGPLRSKARRMGAVVARAGDFPGRDPWKERPYCPVDPSHRPFTRLDYDISLRNAVTVRMSHSRRDELIIWAHSPGSCVVHEQLLAEMDKRGFTGYTHVPSEVRFTDGTVSREYHRIEVIGFGGLARPESGIRLVSECPGCSLRGYGRLEDARQLIDESQWTGEDFFFVWPLYSRWLITARVGEYLKTAKIKTCVVQPLMPIWDDIDYPLGFRIPDAIYERTGVSISVGSVRNMYPEELVNKYRRPPDII